MRRVTLCTRLLTCPQNSAQALSSAAKLPYSARRFVSVGTKSALAILTAFSLPPLLAGSAGTHVAMLSP
jgi:tetrahydromethanopterin S-methyltransferase subunit E